MPSQGNFTFTPCFACRFIANDLYGGLNEYHSKKNSALCAALGAVLFCFLLFSGCAPEPADNGRKSSNDNLQTTPETTGTDNQGENEPEVPVEPEEWPAKPTEPVQNGAYFAAGSDFFEYAVIYEDYLTLFWAYENGDSVRFSHNGEYYTGSSIRTNISFKVFGDVLTVKITRPGLVVGLEPIIIQLIKNPAIGVSAEEPKQVFPPENVAFHHSGQFMWQFFDEDGNIIMGVFFPRFNGIVGAGLEIKYPGSEDFTDVSINNYYGGPVWTFFIYTPRNLPQGTYTVRIKHLGGPFVQWEDFIYQRDEGVIKLSLDSQPLYFKLTVDSDGNMSAEEISEY